MEELLAKSGLSLNESKVFLVLLELGRGTVTQITRKAGINRTTGYDVLGNLVEKGLASISGKEPKQEYVAESPDRLVAYLENKINEEKKEFEAVKKILPELKSRHNVRGRPKVLFYEGKEGMERVYEDTLTSHEPIRAYANVNEMHKALPNYFPEYYKRRTKKGIAIRAIIPVNEAGLERAKLDQAEARESALVPSEMFDFIPEINIYDNKVMIASWQEKLGIIIESAEIADAMKKIYELAWAEARRIDTRLKKP